MPSKSRKQARLMAAVAHGWRGSSVPVKVAKEFHRKDKSLGRLLKK
jgi:hypothetical protein